MDNSKILIFQAGKDADFLCAVAGYIASGFAVIDNGRGENFEYSILSKNGLKMIVKLIL